MAGDDLLQRIWRFHRDGLIFARDHWLPTIPTDAQRKAVADAVTTRYQLTDHHFQPAANPWQLQLIGLGRFDARTFSVTCTRRTCLVTARYPSVTVATDNDDDDSILGGLAMGLLGCAESRVGPATYYPDEIFMVDVADDLHTPTDLPPPGDAPVPEDHDGPEDVADTPPPGELRPSEDLRAPEESVAPDDVAVVDAESADLCIVPMMCDVAEAADTSVLPDFDMPDPGADIAPDGEPDVTPDVAPDVVWDVAPDVPIVAPDVAPEDLVDVITTADPGAEDLPVPDIAPDPGPVDEGPVVNDIVPPDDVPPLPPDPMVYGVAKGMIVAMVYIDVAMTQVMAVCEEPELMATKESCWPGTWIAVAPLSELPINGAVLCYDPQFGSECQADEPVPINQACCMACNEVVGGFNDCDLYCGGEVVGFGKLVADAVPPFLVLTMELFAMTQVGTECVYSFSSKACPKGLQTYTCQ